MSAVPTLEWAGLDRAGPASQTGRRHGGERVRAMMAESGIDALILVGPANVAYATGATGPAISTDRSAVERPVAVVLGDDPVAHLFTPFLADAAVGLGLDDDHLHGPAYLDLAEGLEAFARTIGTLVPRTATVAVDEVTGAMQFLDADIVDAGPALRAVRRTKAPDEVAAIRSAVQIADAALAAALGELRPGTSEREVAAVVRDVVTACGGTVASAHDAVRITSLRDLGGTRTREQVQVGDLVAVHAGVLVDGYRGTVGRTWCVGYDPDDAGPAGAVADLYHRSEELGAILFDACQPGAPASALLDAYRRAGEPLPVMPIGRGLGLGLDDPVIARHLPETAAIERLDPGVVLVITTCVFDDALGSVIAHQPVLITAEGPELLSSSPSRNHDLVGAHP